MSNLKSLTGLYDREDFQAVWRSIATHIKIKKLHTFNIDKTPEFRDLPEDKKYEAKELIRTSVANYQTIEDKGWVYSSDLIVFVDKEWIGWFQYHYISALMKWTAMLLGLGIGAGGVYYLWPYALPYTKSLLNYISTNYENILNVLIQYITCIMTGVACRKVTEWLCSRHSEFNILITACILKKIQETASF